MTEKLKQTTKEEIAKLPKEKQEAINGVDWPKISEEIGKKFLLTESELNDFQVQILLVLISLTDADLFQQNIENEVGTSKEEAEQIADEAFQKIFTPIVDIGTENIKKSLPNIKPDWRQSVDFVLTGGDYSSLIKDRGSAPLPATNNSAPVKTPGGMTDIRSKFVI